MCVQFLLLWPLLGTWWGKGELAVDLLPLFVYTAAALGGCEVTVFCCSVYVTVATRTLRYVAVHFVYISEVKPLLELLSF